MPTSRDVRDLRSALRRQDLEEFFETFLPELSRLQPLWPRDWNRLPAVDLVDRGEALVLTVEMPGVRKEDMEISVLEDRVTLKGSVKKPGEEPGETVLTRERLYGDFARTVRLPVPVDADSAEARLEHGLLVLTLTKRRDARAKRVEIRSE